MARRIGRYLLKEKIYESSKSEVYRGICEADRQPRILKILKQDYPTHQELTHYRQEYEIARQLDTDGVIAVYGIEPDRRTLAIVLEDFGATSLSQLLRSSRLFPAAGRDPIRHFLTLAIAIVDALGHIHAANIIHKDINPANIVYNPQTHTVKIIDFGISTVLTRENPILKHPNVLEGTLAYMSPEQTGRMNRPVDYRTDFYSLGATFYELLTGRPPFVAVDVMELVHCHLAKQPEPPNQVLARQGKPTLPQPICDIVMKLMAKTAENRYQSAWGIKSDLEACLKRLEETDRIESFPLGARDISDRFQIPQKLYGREQEIATLLAAFERVSTPRSDAAVVPAAALETQQSLSARTAFEIMLVAGDPGIGKSALVREIYKPITAKKGYFISGKFDQFQRNTPYSALVDAFRGLVRQLLTESSAQLALWKQQLLGALQPNGQIIVDIIPEVELIIGKQPEVAPLGPVEAQNRFNFVFLNFMQVFCKSEHPLVIFLDDLQWVDAATLKSIEAIATSHEIQHLFLIGAYRDNEVNSMHPLAMSLENLQKQQITIHEISLTPLDLTWTGQLIAETLDSTVSAVAALSRLVQQKTQGNPFFVNQFLKALHTDRLIDFDVSTLSWQWDIDQIEAQNITDNVVELMIKNIRTLPTPAQQALRLAACIGASFDLRTLAIVSKRSSQEVFQTLLPATQAGLIFPISELDPQLLIQSFKFGHDRIQQAAYALIETGQRQEVHRQIGQLLQANLSASEQSERIFELADHLNLGRDLIVDPAERIRLAMLNLEAAKRAKESTAHTAALQYLAAGIACLGENSWEESYDLSFNLYREQAEVSYINGDLEQSELLISTLLSKARTAVEKAEIYNLLMLQYTLLTKYPEAIEAGRNGLELLGVNLPQDNLEREFEAQFCKAEEILERREIAALLHQSEVTAPEQIAVVKLLSGLMSPTYLSDQNLFAAISAISSIFCFEHGPTSDSAMIYCCYSTVLISYAGNYQEAYEFATMSLKLLERFRNSSNKAQVYLMTTNFVAHWVKPVRSLLAINQEGYRAALLSGDIIFAGYMLHCMSIHAFYQGSKLETVIESQANYLELVREDNNILTTNTLSGYQIAAYNLNGRTRSRSHFCSDRITEAEYLRNIQAQKDYFSAGFYYILKSQISYLYGRYKLALRFAALAENFIPFTKCFITTAEHNFYYSLSLVATCVGASSAQYDLYRKQLAVNQEQLKIWADNCPENFLHKYLLVRAELSRITSPSMETMQLYDRAIASAAENGYIQNEALGNELAAKFWLEQGKEDFAEIYMKSAYHSYQLWGAIGKVDLLEATYPQWFGERAPEYGNSVFVTATTERDRALESLDIESVLEASQALSEEILLENLLAKLMQLAIENAGAQRGFLLLETAGRWFIEAEGNLDSEKISVRHSIAIDTPDRDGRLPLSSAIVNYVARSLESIVLDNAALTSQYSQDPYIADNQIASVLCIPLLARGDLNGVLYLENNLIEGAFTPDRIEVLKLLSSQAAISLNNARLYEALQESERNLAQFLEGVPVGVAVLRRDGNVHYMNRRAREVLGRGIEPIDRPAQLSEAYELYLAGTDLSYPSERLPGLRALQGEAVTADDLEVRQGGRVIPLEVWATPIFDERGQVTYAIAAFKDITQRKQAEAERLRFNQELSAKNLALEQASNALAEYSQTLEQKVRERTAELADANQRITALNAQLRAENVRMEAELNVARQIQQMVLPKPQELGRLEGLDIACSMQPAAEVAGDYYDVLQTGNRVTLGIGDVTGHGLESGLLMLMVQTAVRTLTEVRERDPVRFLGALNRTVYSNVQRMGSQKSLTLAILDYSDGRVTISGQHEEVLVVRADGRVERIDTIDLGMPIGLDDDIDRFIGQATVELAVGDGVVLYTDGILEAIDLEEKQYGMERFCRAIQRNWERDSQAIKQAIIEDVRRFIGKQRVYDDIALLVLKRQ